jgi:hypothetical protein
MDNYDRIIDYLAWGSGAGTSDDDAVTWNQWTNESFIDISIFQENETIGRDKLSTDTDTTGDWEKPTTGDADPFGLHASSQTSGAQNVDPSGNILINEIMHNPIGGPFDTDWDYKKRIRIYSSQVAGDLTDFPILINITDNDLKNNASSDGSDILFTLTDNETKLDHEIESYDSNTGQLIAWVKIPFLSSTTDTFIYMYYGNSGSSNQQNPEGVWSNGFVGVYHMNEATGNINNSASASNDGTRVNTPTRVSSPFNYGQEFTGGGADDMFDIGDLGLADGVQENLTLSFWANIDDAALESWGRIICKRDDSNSNTVYGAYMNDDISDKDIVFYAGSESGTSEIPKSKWIYVTFTYYDSLKVHYQNGSWVRDDIGGGGPIGASSQAPVTIGAREGPTQNFGGILDEVRISNVERSAEWIETEFNNQNMSNTFFTLNSQESTSAESTYEWVELYNPSDTAVDVTGWYLTDNDGNKFYLDGVGTIPAGGYLVSHLSEAGTNSSTDVYGSITSQAIIQPDASAGKDSCLDNTMGIMCCGEFTGLTVMNNGGTDKRPIFQFSISDMSMGEIIDANIWLYRGSGDITTDATTKVHRVTQSWVEGDNTANSGANWATYDGTNNWATAGGDYDSTAEDTTTILADTNAWYSWDISNLVRNWTSGSVNNYGMIFVSNSGSPAHFVYSSDYSVDTSLRPKLIINYSKRTMLENSDDLALLDDNENIIDYVAWGSNADSDDDDAVTWQQWTDGRYIDTSQLLENETLGRDQYSTDTNLPVDWENISASTADPFGIHATNQTEGYQNLDGADSVLLINEIMFKPATSGWLYRKKIVVDSDKVTNDLTNYPMLFKITDPNLASKARSDGFDIYFSSSDGSTRLNHEIEYYNSGTGELIAWVNVTYLSSSIDTTIYMIYGNPSATDQQNPESVWDENFASVWHLNETGDGSADEFKDSTSNNIDGVGGSGKSWRTPTRTSGKIGYGQDFDGITDYINVSKMDPRSYDDFTISAWYKSSNSTSTDDQYIFNQIEEYSLGPGITFGISDDGGHLDQLRLVTYNETNDGKLYYGTSDVADQEYHFLTVVRANNRIKIYVDGVEETDDFDNHAGQTINVDAIKGPYIGDYPNNAECVNGTIDELRITNGSRNASWIETEFNNQNDTNSFCTVYAEELIGYQWVEIFNNGTSTVDLTGWTLSDNDGNTFSLSGATSISAGGYLVCHLGQAGTNSSTDVYGPPGDFLEDSDDLQLNNSRGEIVDYVAWGADAGADDDDAVTASEWTDGTYIDTSKIAENETIGRDMYSTDTNTPADWENATSEADPYGINATIGTPHAQNVNIIIPEFNFLIVPITIIALIILITNRYKNNSKSNENSQKKKRRVRIRKKR